MSKPLVSIVMAAYNEEKHIREAIESVLSQTYTHFDFIIIDDGSTDSTKSIILSYKDDRIRLICNEQNLKLIDSLNKGLSIATGKYVARMDADDICLPERLEKQVAYMEANPEIGISGSQLTMFGATEGVMKYPLTDEDIRLRLLFTSCFGNNVVIFRKDLMIRHQLFFPKGYLHAEDYKCWTEWIMHTKGANIDECLVKYRTHPDSVSVKNRSAQRETRNRIRAEYLIKLFDLEESSTADSFTGDISSERAGAIKIILEKNRKKNLFEQKKLEDIIHQIWYSDCLERIEHSFIVFFRFPLIFKSGLGINFGTWLNLLKHYINMKREKNA
jgi:glycosyltransferase involved in cell wall biosynthesis